MIGLGLRQRIPSWTVMKEGAPGWLVIIRSIALVIDLEDRSNHYDSPISSPQVPPVKPKHTKYFSHLIE